MGAVMSYFFLLRPAVRVMAARNWTQTRCRIVRSAVGVHFGDKGTTYSVDIEYSYRVGRRMFTSTNYDFMGGSSSGRSWKETVVDRYPAGKPALCYVNPANPADAVLNRGLPDSFPVGLVPLAFMAAGATGLVISRKQRKAGSPAGLWAPAAIPATGVTILGSPLRRAAGDIGPVSAQPAGAQPGGDPVELKPPKTRLGNAVTGLVLTILFTGVIGTVLYSQIPKWKATGVDWGLVAFLGIFGIMGVIILLGTVKAFMQLWDPRVHVRLAPGTPRLGGDFAVSWETEGGRKQLSELRIMLECREESDWHGDKQEHTAISVCYRQELVNAQGSDALVAGSVSLKAPAGVMHSFNGGRNRIAWKLRVLGKVPRWAGIEDEYPVVLLPEGWEGKA